MWAGEQAICLIVVWNLLSKFATLKLRRFSIPINTSANLLLAIAVIASVNRLMPVQPDHHAMSAFLLQLTPGIKTAKN